MTALDTSWALYGDAGVPLWLVAVAVIAVSWAMVHWVRAETATRRGRLARILPFTLLPICLLLALVAYEPVITKTTTWQQQKSAVAVLDRSRSMELTLSPETQTAHLDLLAISRGRALPHRSRSAANLADTLQHTAAALTTHIATLEAVAAQEAQGIPSGSKIEAATAAYTTWRKDLLGHLPRDIAALDTDLAKLRNPDAENDSGAAAAVDALRTNLAQLPETLTADGAGRHLQDLRQTTQTLLPVLRQMQTQLDQNWLAAHGEAHQQELAALLQTTRYDLLRTVAKALPESAGIRLIDSAAADETDLNAMCEQALAGSELDQVGHVLLFSDGANTGVSSAQILQRLREEGCGFTAVGLPPAAGGGVDVALRQWRVPPVARAGRETVVSVSVRMPPDISTRPTIRLLSGDDILAQQTLTAGVASYDLSYKAAEAGRHLLRLELQAAADAVPQNNTAYFVHETVTRNPKLLFVGDTPDWDTAYLSTAAERTGLDLDQAYHAGAEPKRGPFSGSVPKTASQWHRKAAVVLAGNPFPGFATADGAALHKLVVEKGATLLLYGADRDSYLQLLADRFGWRPASDAAAGRMQLQPENAHMPLVDIADDPAVSARHIAALPPLQTANAVPPQDLVLLETASGVPLVSLGFYGRGKVILWGLRDLRRLRGFGHTATVDRLLENLLTELVRPVRPLRSKSPVGLYPPLPVAGRDLYVIRTAKTESSVSLDGKPLAFHPGAGAPLAKTVLAVGRHQLKSGPWQKSILAARNPGRELLAPGLEPTALKRMARTAGGTYVSAAAARPKLRAVDPGVRKFSTSAVYRPSRHWLVLPLLLVLFTVHWIIRKLSGLVL